MEIETWVSIQMDKECKDGEKSRQIPREARKTIGQPEKPNIRQIVEKIESLSTPELSENDSCSIFSDRRMLR